MLAKLKNTPILCTFIRLITKLLLFFQQVIIYDLDCPKVVVRGQELQIFTSFNISISLSDAQISIFQSIVVGSLLGKISNPIFGIIFYDLRVAKVTRNQGQPQGSHRQGAFADVKQIFWHHAAALPPARANQSMCPAHQSAHTKSLPLIGRQSSHACRLWEAA